MIDPISFYTAVKFWLPVVTAFTFVYKAWGWTKKNFREWADTLLNNHLYHIEQATTLTHTETVKTNTLLAASALADAVVAQKLSDTRVALDTHNEKQEQVWLGVLNTLTVLEDRTRNRPRRAERRKTKSKSRS